MKDKVYCKDCKHLRGTQFWGYGNCAKPEVEEDKWLEHYTINTKPWEKNKNNDCEDYESKV